MNIVIDPRFLAKSYTPAKVREEAKYRLKIIEKYKINNVIFNDFVCAALRAVSLEGNCVYLDSLLIVLHLRRRESPYSYKSECFS